MSMTNPTSSNPVRITVEGFKCERCGATANATPGAIMSAYMREVIAFETAHAACTYTAERRNAPN